MAPFVNQGEIEGGIQVNGASGAENVFTVDGLSTTSVINGSSRQGTVFEYIQEVQVKTTGLAAEFSGALGGVISAVTKSGGNIFNGEVHYHFGGSLLSAAPVKRLVLNPLDDRTVAYVQDEKQPELRHEIGGSLGGPSSVTDCSSLARSRLPFSAEPENTCSPQGPTKATSHRYRSGSRPSVS